MRRFIALFVLCNSILLYGMTSTITIKEARKEQRKREQDRQRVFDQMQANGKSTQRNMQKNMLLKFNLGINGYDRDLLWNIAQNNKERVEELLAVCDVNYHLPGQNWTPLQQAIGSQRPEMVKLLIDADARLDQPCLRHKTVLELALGYRSGLVLGCSHHNNYYYHYDGNPEIVEVLLKNGVKITQQDVDRFNREVVETDHENDAIKKRAQDVLAVLEKYKVRKSDRKRKK